MFISIFSILLKDKWSCILSASFHNSFYNIFYHLSLFNILLIQSYCAVWINLIFKVRRASKIHHPILKYNYKSHDNALDGSVVYQSFSIRQNSLRLIKNSDSATWPFWLNIQETHLHRNNPSLTKCHMVFSETAFFALTIAAKYFWNCANARVPYQGTVCIAFYTPKAMSECLCYVNINIKPVLLIRSGLPPEIIPFSGYNAKTLLHRQKTIPYIGYEKSALWAKDRLTSVFYRPPIILLQ